MRAASVVVALAAQCFPDWDKPTGRHEALSLLDALRLAPCRLRRNATYQDLHEDFGISPSTAWDYHQAMVAFLADALGTGDQAELPALVAGRVCLIGGTLTPTANWRHRRDLYSSRHRKHGVDVELLVDLHGRIIAASRAFPGSWHDVHCFREAGWVKLVHRCGGAVGDPGYQGEPDAAHTPIKKPQHRDFTDLERDLNRSFARIRAGVERGAGHLTNWRILSTRHRSDLSRIDTDTQAVVGLQKLNERFADRPLSYDRTKAV